MLAEKLLSAVCVCVLVTFMAAFNNPFSQSIAGILRGEPSTALAFFGGRTVRVARIVAETIGSYTGDHTALVLFGVVAVVLLGLMFRS